MSKEKEFQGWPMPPMWDASEWDSTKEKGKAKAEEVKAGLKEFWEKSIDLQKSTIDGGKGQFDEFFAYIQETKDGFAESLPEELPWMPLIAWMPWMPSWTKTPKSFRKAMKEWEEMANEHFKEQLDSWANFVIQSQEKAVEQIPEAEEAAEEPEADTKAKAK